MKNIFDVRQWQNIPTYPDNPSWMDKTYTHKEPIEARTRPESEIKGIEGYCLGDTIHFSVSNRPIIQVLDNTLINNIKVESLISTRKGVIRTETGFDFSDYGTIANGDQKSLYFKRGICIVGGKYIDYIHKIYNGQITELTEDLKVTFQSISTPGVYYILIEYDSELNEVNWYADSTPYTDPAVEEKIRLVMGTAYWNGSVWSEPQSGEEESYTDLRTYIEGVDETSDDEEKNKYISNKLIKDILADLLDHENRITYNEDRIQPAVNQLVGHVYNDGWDAIDFPSGYDTSETIEQSIININALTANHTNLLNHLFESGIDDEIKVDLDINMNGHSITGMTSLSSESGMIDINSDMDFNGNAIYNLGLLDASLNLNGNPISNSSDIIKRNWIMNGDFNVWQRGTSFVVATTGSDCEYTSDRWCFEGDATVTREQFEFGQTDVEDNPKYYYKVDDSNGNYNIMNRIEDGLSLIGQRCYFSCYINKISGGTDGTSYIVLRAYNGKTNSTTYSATTVIKTIDNSSLTEGEWTKIEVEDIDLTSSNTDLSSLFSSFDYNSNGFLEVAFLMSTASGTIDIGLSHVQLNQGSKCPFEKIPFNEELQRCQRYFEKSYSYGTVPGTTTSLGKEWARFSMYGYSGGGTNSLDDGATIVKKFEFSEIKRNIPIMKYYSSYDSEEDNAYFFYWTGSRATNSNKKISTDLNNTNDKCFYVKNDNGDSILLIPVNPTSTASCTEYWGNVSFHWTAESELYLHNEAGYESEIEG